MKKKILSGILALAVMISCSNGISVSAETLQSTPENIISENDGQMEFLQISDEEVPATEIPETELNVEERNYTGTDLSLSSIMPYSENDDVSNADPNYAYLTYKEDAMPDVWIKEAFTKDVAQTVLEDTKEVINNSHGTGYAAHRTDIILAGKTGTAEIKASKDDTTGTELGWFSVFTTDKNMERPIMIVSMVEDVKGRGGSGYVVKKDSQVLEKWFSGN